MTIWLFPALLHGWRQETVDKAGVQGSVNQNMIGHTHTVLRNVIIPKISYL